MGKFFVWCPDLAEDVASMTAVDGETAAKLFAEKSYKDEPFDDQPMRVVVEHSDGDQQHFWVTPTPTVVFDVVKQ